MQAYKVKGRVDATGHLIVAEAIELTPGEVEVIVLQAPIRSEAVPDLDQLEDLSAQRRSSPIKAFQGLFETAPAVPPDFDPDQAKWEYLREKYDL